MGKDLKSKDPLAASLRNLAKRMDIIIALSAMESDQPAPKKIRLLAKFGMTYD